ncbi:MAG: hypothetical protein AVDCRST_MAG53-623 [uncultured Solirubrobacteraceae bacterium]|uniref:Uncharacterized protein n=1 Tax=uncultured Solirubrobacteraceae bacterium TaxID=1162706 RepID=A0A6J4RP61_9ACTN|nr:MAG: hypothetical protein AVDCRST_MAG53-623 [uncultured Solirubrobacteraceae bacterium]
MDWTGYELFDPGVDGPLARVSLEQARMHFDKLMAEREERKAQLAALLARDAITLGGDDASVSALDHWFRDRVAPRPGKPQLMAEEWYSVATDMGVHLGDLLVAEHPWLRWELFVGDKHHVNHHRPVLTGFRVKHEAYNVDIDASVQVIGHRQINAMELMDEELVPFLHALAAEATGRR